MWPYVVLITLPMIVQHVKIKGSNLISSNNRNKVSMKLFWFLLLVLLMIRHKDVGRDLLNYERIFTLISNHDWTYALQRSSEPAYNILNKCISLLTSNFQWIIVITSILSVYFVAKTYINDSEDTSLSIAIFITMSNFIMLFSGLRQSIAISLGFLAYELTKEKKLILFLVVVCIAMLFHTSAFMLFIMYPIYHKRITKKDLILIVPILTVVWSFNKQIFVNLSSILMSFTRYEAVLSSTGAVTMLILFSIFAIYSFVITKESKIDDEINGLRNFLLLSVALQMFAPLHTLAMRMNYYYIAFIPLLMSKLYKCTNPKYKQIFKAIRYVMIIFFVVYFIINAPKDNVLDTFPYKFFWCV